ncbi:MAG: phosphate ABC transporter permease subunit PstC [Firmicutes bacterium]|nr:phosphate ABC transporter permease subunit PstC [Bacillota bacterium]
MTKREWLIERVLFACALTAVSALALITGFIFREGVPELFRTGPLGFVLGTVWSPSRTTFGILPMIAGSVVVTVGALVIGVPIAVACAVFLSEMAPGRMGVFLKALVELLAAIPSVVYGFIGLTTLVPAIRQATGTPGFSALAAAIVLAIMIIPTIASVSFESLRAVPVAYRDSMAALGSTRWQSIRMVLLPAASSGIIAGIILGIGRSLGETMAVLMVAGNAPAMPGSVLSPVRTLTSNIALEMGYAAGRHRDALFATAVVLFVMIACLNLLTRMVISRGAAYGGKKGSEG